MIAQDAILTERRLQRAKTVDIGFDLPGHIIHQIARKNKKIAILHTGQIDAFLYSSHVVKTAGMDIGDLCDREPVKVRSTLNVEWP